MIIARLFSIRKRLFWGWLSNKISTKYKVNPYAPSQEAEFMKCHSNKIPIECSSLVLVTEWIKGSDLQSLRQKVQYLLSPFLMECLVT